MEEKERYYYKKILRDCVMPEGLFEIKDRESNFYLIIENKKDVDTITNLLNQQDKRIKELEETNKVLSNELTKNSILKQRHIETCCGIPIFEIPKMKEENQQLKQQLAEKEKEIEYQESMKILAVENKNKKAIEQLEKVKRTFIDVAWKDVDFAIEIIDNQIKELKGEK